MAGIQSDLICGISWAVLKLMKELKKGNYFETESTIKNHFFRKIQNIFGDEYALSSEVNIQKIINTQRIGFYDFYAEYNYARTCGKDVAIEFKINCQNLKLIKNDLEKLDYFSKKHKQAESIFIDVFTKEIDFNNLYRNIIGSIRTKANFIFIAPSFRKVYFNKTKHVVDCLEDDKILVVTNSLKVWQGIPDSCIIVRTPDRQRSTLLKPKMNIYYPGKLHSGWKCFILKIV